VEAAKAKNRPLPSWYLEEPPLLWPCDYFMNAFWALSTERQIGMAPGPIPWSKMVEYGRYSGLEDDMIELLVFLMRYMDTAFREWRSEQDKKRPTQGSDVKTKG
jgi:hypothetical protein